ncbi:MAG: RNA methyltransferase [Thermodesulfobacteriota bacterium]
MTEAGQGVRLAVALVHYPVLNRNGETIGSAVTNLDLHDIARASRTFGVADYFVVTPHEDQQQLVREIVGHWQEGHGATYNPKRKEALSLVRLCGELAECYAALTGRWGKRPTVLATSARVQEKTVPYEEARQRLADGEPILLLFGTGWGMAPEVMAQVDGLLPPICGPGEYNHLSVRSAVSIILDRLLGNR